MIEKIPVVSIIIPTYNRVVKLEKAIKSVLNQTVVDFEIIVVNDSPEEDSVIDLIGRLGDSRIRYFQNKRSKGGSGARNTGILSAKGQYIALLDDDDEWMPGKLEAQVKKMVSLDSTWGGCYCGFIRKERLKWKEYLCSKEGWIKKDYLLNKVMICGGSTLFFKRSALDYINLFDEELDRHQDTYFVIVFLRHFKIAYINELLVRINGHNFTSAEKIERSKLLLFKKIKHDILELSKSERKIFYAYQYIDLAIAFSLDSNTKKVIYYFLKSISYRFSLSKKFRFRYVALIILFINTKIGWLFRGYRGLDNYKNPKERAKIIQE